LATSAAGYSRPGQRLTISVAIGTERTWLDLPLVPAKLGVAGQVFQRAGTFSDRPTGTAFWYENSNGLVEIAVNQGRADRDLGLAIGSPVEMAL
jgi:S-adenosyl-L-methionine hydrolase (adenosine-forming)